MSELVGFNIQRNR